MLFRNIIGQEKVKQRLIKSVHESRVSHAQLFVAREGVGALPLALAYTQLLLCTDKQQSDSCGKCPSCLKSEKLVHPDIHFVYPIALQKDVRVSTHLASEWREAVIENPYQSLSDWFVKLSAENKQPVIGVEESAEILRRLQLTTYEGEFKVMIIWLPEKMNVQAANKLLKILEEPPDKTIFLLITENEEVLLRTIVSRTQLIKVNHLSDEEIKNALVSSKHVLSDKATRIAYLAYGNYNKALALLSEDGGDINYFHSFRDWMRMCFKADIILAFTWVEEMVGAKAGREKQKDFLLYGISMFRECLMYLYGDKTGVRAAGEELVFIEKFSLRIDGNSCKRFYEEFNEALLHLERNGSAKIIFTDLSIKCIRIARQPQAA